MSDTKELNQQFLNMIKEQFHSTPPKEETYEDNVVRLPGETTLELDAAMVLSSARLTEWDHILILGVDKDGEFQFRVSKPTIPENLTMLEMAKWQLAQIGGW